MDAPEEREDVGPDPVWGVALFVVGLLNMAVSGALTKHWWFNVGEAILLLGAVVFLGSLAWCAILDRRAEGWGALPMLGMLRRWRGRDARRTDAADRS